MVVAKRYSRVMPREVGGTVTVASRNYGVGTERTVHWHGWRITKAPTPSDTPAPPAAVEKGASPHEPGATATYGGIEFVWCPPGVFTQGTARALDTVVGMVGGFEEWFSDEQPSQPRQVADGFWMSKTEVTRGQWEAVMGRAADGDGPADAPVTGVPWEQCVAFVEKLNGAGEGDFALPTETQWEYACRAGAETLFPFGEDPAPLPDHAWLRANAPDGAVQAGGQKKPNAWGLCDMLGNAWEWCSDAYGSYTPDSPRPLRGYRTIRGGGVDSTAMYARPAFRCAMAEGQAHPHVGFRVVRMP
jgi:formylglycine-generating enzyme required for sulfatase activity